MLKRQGPALVCVLAVWTMACSDSAPATGGVSGSGSTPASSGGAPSSRSGPIDACTLLSQADVAAAVGNPVLKGEHFAGSEVCKWDTSDPAQVNVLLTVRPVGGIRAKPLCDGLRTANDKGVPLAGLGDLAFWKYASGKLFDSGDLEMCHAKGFVALSLNGKADEDRMRKAMLAIVTPVIGKM